MAQFMNSRQTSPVSVAVGGLLPVGSVVHKSGCTINAAGTAVTITGAGMYKINASVSFAPTATGAVTVSVLANGNEIARATQYATTAARAVNVSLVGSVFRRCGCGETVITLQVTAEGSLAELDITAEKVA